MASRKNERWFRERSEEEFRGELHRARITNTSDPAKIRSACDVQAGESTEVCVVENVEDFRAQLQSR